MRPHQRAGICAECGESALLYIEVTIRRVRRDVAEQYRYVCRECLTEPTIEDRDEDEYIPELMVTHE